MDSAVSDYVATNYEGLVVEVGVGDRTVIAEALADEPHLEVLVTDAKARSVDGVPFVRDDVTDPDRSIYCDAVLLYALRPPPELHRPIAALAASVDADALVVPHGNDSVPVPNELVDHRGTGLRLLEPR